MLNSAICRPIDIDFVDFPVNFSGYRVELASVTPMEIVSYFWIELGQGDYEQFDLQSGINLRIETGDFICRICKGQYSFLTSGFCDDCKNYEAQLFTRLECLYNRSTSQINVKGGCSKQQPACTYQNNTSLCHTRYVFYIGRIGNYFKAGISRKYRRGTYLTRLVEQGLQEAMVIEPFSSLPEVLDFERSAFELGIHDRLQFSEKVGALQNPSRLTLQDLWSEEFWEISQPEKQVSYHNIYPTYILPSKAKYIESTRLEGEIVHIQGSLLVLSRNDCIEVVNLQKLTYRELIELEVWS